MYFNRLSAARTLAIAAALSFPLALPIVKPAIAREPRQEERAPEAQPTAPAPQSPTPPPSEPKTPAGPATRPTTQPAAEAPPEPHASFMEPALAERLGEFAQNRLREPAVTEPMWRQSAAALEAATRLSPRDPRFPRLLVEARLKLNDTEAAIKVLVNYRKLDPADRVVQIKLIDLYVAGMQTADARLEYLRDVLGRATVPAEVRSHAAAMCVPLLLERSREEAMAMLDESLRLFPVSPEALRLRYGMMDESTTPAQRCAVLLSLLRSNPAQPEVIDELADLLASSGLNKDSIEWYTVALRLYPRMGRDYPAAFIAEVGSQLLLANQTESLETLLTSYLKARPDDADAWFMRLVKEKAAGDKAKPGAVDEARLALTGNWSAVNERIAGREPATQDAAPGGPQGGLTPAAIAPGPGSPAPAPFPGGVAAAPPASAGPSPADAVKRIKSGEAEEWKGAFVGALADLAWLELYFAEKPDAAAPWVGALKEVLPADNVTVARLDGWLDLLQNRPDDARAKLTPVADRDPLAAVGVVRLAAGDAKSQADADDRAARLLADHPTGLLSAIIRTGLAGRTTKAPEHPAAGEVAAELQKFPRDWMEILNKPTAYYKVSADVLKVAHRYGEPLLARVSITNITDYDITVGPDGILRPDLWFDAKLGGLANQAFPGVAYDRIHRIVVLHPKQPISQIIRIDQGPLGQELAAKPSVSTQVLASVVTNPVAAAEGVGPGAAGVRQPFKALSRAGFPLSQPSQRKRVMTALESGTPAEKVRNLDLVAAFVRIMTESQQLDEPTRAIGIEFADALNRGRDDTVPAVAAYATYITARLSSPEARGPLVEKLLANENWPARLLGLIAAEGMGPDRETQWATRLAEGDPDPAVKAFAAAMMDHLKNPPSTQPSTQPAAGAGSDAGGGGAGGAPGARPQLPAGQTPPGLSVPSQPPTGAKTGG